MMNRGERVATQLRDDLFIDDNIDFPLLKDICLIKDAYVKLAKISGAQGRIIFSNNSNISIITIDDTIAYEPKRKFVLAHELGHRLLHFKLMNFICNEQDMNIWNNTNGRFRYEKEANSFAAALLMPKSSFKSYVRTSELSGGLIKNVSKKFGTSITSACIHYTQYGNQPCYLICSQNGKIRWVSKSDDIYWGYIKKGEKLPLNSTPKYFFDQGKQKEREVCSIFDWFPNYDKNDFSLFEESIYLETYSTVLTFLWPCDKYN